MNDFRIITAIVLVMLLIERLVVLNATRHEKGREFFRKCRLLHPNTLSLLRLPMGIASAILASMGFWSLATLWFAMWMITDLSDGTIARNCDLGTESGKWLDPLSDKFMYFPVLLFFSFSGSASPRLDPIPVIAFIVIDIIGQASRLFVKKKAANQFGKAKTALVTTLLSIMALNQIDNLDILTPRIVNGIMWAALLLAFLSCFCKIVPDIWYANTLTFANFICGAFAIYMAYKSYFIHCMILVFIGQFFDLFDGRMARKYGSTKRGALFDDIADATSFGLAIGSMVYVCLSKCRCIPRQLAAVIAVLYICCLIYRLYRFIHPTAKLPRGIFQGLPSPAGAMFAGSAVLVAVQLQSVSSYIAAAVIVLFSSLLMISNIHYCHFGQRIWPAIPKGTKMLIFILLIILSVLAVSQKKYGPYFIWCCFSLTVFYIIYGIHGVNRLPEIEPQGKTEEQ